MLLPCLLVVLGGTLHIGLRIWKARGLQATLLYLLLSLITVPVSTYLLVLEGSPTASIIPGVYFLAGFTLLLTPILFFLSASALDTVRESSIWQFTILFWAFFAGYCHWLPFPITLVLIVASFLIALDAFHRFPESQLMKLYYSLWHSFLSATFIMVALYATFGTLYEDKAQLNLLSLGFAGIVIVSRLTALCSSLLLIASVLRDTGASYYQLEWPDQYLETRLEPKNAFLLLCLWMLLGAINIFTGIFSAIAFALIGVGIVTEYLVLTERTKPSPARTPATFGVTQVARRH